MHKNTFDPEWATPHDHRLSECAGALERAADAIAKSVQGDGTIYAFGNGGSAADADHVVAELVKPFLMERPLDLALRERLQEGCSESATDLADRLRGGIRAIALTGPASVVSAIANDMGAELLFAQQLVAFARPGDVCLAISTSGESGNVVNGALVARARGAITVGLTGRSGNSLASVCDIAIQVPADRTDRIQELHQVAYHWLCGRVEQLVFGRRVDSA